MINHVDKLIKSGLSSLKIEGRVKNEYYIAITASVYRDAIDTYYKDSENFKINPEWIKELTKISHRDYTTGFYFEKTDEICCSIIRLPCGNFAGLLYSRFRK